MKQKKQNKIYEVLADLSAIPLNKAQNSFEVKCENSVLGKLKFSRGSIQWFSHNAKKATRKLTWKQFADMMSEEN